MAAVSRTTYYTIFALLMILLFATVAVAYFPLGIFGILIAMTIAMVKALLIVLYFMHVRYEVPLVQIFAVSGFLWLGLLLVFLVSDYRTRYDVTRLAPFTMAEQPAEAAPAAH